MGKEFVNSSCFFEMTVPLYSCMRHRRIRLVKHVWLRWFANPVARNLFLSAATASINLLPLAGKTCCNGEKACFVKKASNNRVICLSKGLLLTGTNKMEAFI